MRPPEQLQLVAPFQPFGSWGGYLDLTNTYCNRMGEGRLVQVGYGDSSDPLPQTGAGKLIRSITLYPIPLPIHGIEYALPTLENLIRFFLYPARLAYQNQRRVSGTYSARSKTVQADERKLIWEYPLPINTRTSTTLVQQALHLFVPPEWDLYASLAVSDQWAMSLEVVDLDTAYYDPATLAVGVGEIYDNPAIVPPVPPKYELALIGVSTSGNATLTNIPPPLTSNWVLVVAPLDANPGYTITVTVLDPDSLISDLSNAGLYFYYGATYDTGTNAVITQGTTYDTPFTNGGNYTQVFTTMIGNPAPARAGYYTFLVKGGSSYYKGTITNTNSNNVVTDSVNIYNIMGYPGVITYVGPIYGYSDRYISDNLTITITGLYDS